MALRIAELKDVIFLNLDKAPVDNTAYYEMTGVYSFGRGLFRREPVFGGSTSYKFFYKLKPNHFVMSQLFGWEGALAASSTEFEGTYVSPQFPTFLCNEDMLDLRYLSWYAKRSVFWKELGTKTKGMGDRRRTLNPEALLSMKIPLPPLPEQRRMVARIEALAAKIEEAERLSAQVGGEIKTLQQITNSMIFAKTIRSLTRVKDAICLENLKNGLSVRSVESDSPYRCLRLSAMKNGVIESSDTKSVPLTAEQASAYLVHEHDVFIIRGNGSKGLVGRAGIAKGKFENIVFPDLFIKVSLDAQVLIPEFLVAWWNSSYMRDMIEATAKTTSGIWKINQNHIGSFSIPVIPITEQKKILHEITKFKDFISQIQKVRKKSELEFIALQPSFLAKAFNGEV